MAIALLWLLLPGPDRVQAAESLATQQKVDKELTGPNLPLPPPALAHLPVPQPLSVPFTGQPYQQQPAAVVNDAAIAGGGRSAGGGQTPSDRRLKKDVVRLATLENGIRIYSFRYLWGDAVHVGVMAQDLLADPARAHAVVTMPNGYYAVEYAKLGLRMTTLEAWRKRGKAALRLRSTRELAAVR